MDQVDWDFQQAWKRGDRFRDALRAILALTEEDDHPKAVLGWIRDAAMEALGGET